MADLASSNPPRTVPLLVMLRRRECCRACKHASRSTDPRFDVNKGLTTLSICRVAGKKANIARGTRRADRRCPLGYWDTWGGEVRRAAEAASNGK
jgi:hypothetical protein